MTKRVIVAPMVAESGENAVPETTISVSGLYEAAGTGVGSGVAEGTGVGVGFGVGEAAGAEVENEPTKFSGLVENSLAPETAEPLDPPVS